MKDGDLLEKCFGSISILTNEISNFLGIIKRLAAIRDSASTKDSSETDHALFVEMGKLDESIKSISLFEALCLSYYMSKNQPGSKMILAEIGKKIDYPLGAETSTLDSETIIKKLIEQKRFDDLIKVCSTSEKSLKELADGDILISSNKKKGDRKKSSASIKDLSAEDRKLIEN